MSDREAARHIVILGGGFAGTALAQRLQRDLPDGWALTLVSEESYTTFNPMLAETVGASLFPEHVVAPLREVIDTRHGHRFVMGRVVAMDTDTRQVTCETLAGTIDLPYDHLVCAFGARARTDQLPGLAEHALPLITAGDALEIRNTVLRRLGRIELETDPALRRRLGHFVVVGGGFSGVEIAGELVDCLGSIRRFYSRVAADELRVSVVQDIDRLLPELPPPLGEAALASLRGRGVDVRLSAPAADVTGERVTLKDGAVLETACVVCALGVQPNALVRQLDAMTDKGRIITAGNLRVPGLGGVWALGDCAVVPNAEDGGVSAPTAQFAVAQAATLAFNLRATIRGETTRAFSYRSRGMMAAIGRHKGVAQVYGIPLRGFPAWVLWRAYYLSRMPTLRRKLRILGEWTWGLFFPPDITHLRFGRSGEMTRADARTERRPDR